MPLPEKPGMRNSSFMTLSHRKEYVGWKDVQSAMRYVDADERQEPGP